MWPAPGTFCTTTDAPSQMPLKILRDEAAVGVVAAARIGGDDVGDALAVERIVLRDGDASKRQRGDRAERQSLSVDVSSNVLPVPSFLAPVSGVFLMLAGRSSVALGVLQLLEPVKTHRLDDAAVDHDETRLVRLRRALKCL